MAKSKRKRPHSTARPSSGRTPQPVKAAPATPGGPNRIERKEAARKAREAMRRRQARRHVLRRTATLLGVGGAIAAVVFFAVQGGGRKLTAPEQTLIDQAPQAMVDAGCGPVQTIGPYDPETLDRVHIGAPGAPATMPPLADYPSQPPTSGPHAGTTAPAGVNLAFPVAIDAALHSLEHGAVIVWLSPDADASQMTELQDFFEKPEEQTKVIVSAYDYPGQDGGQLPEGKQMVLVAWHRMQVCDKVSLPVAFQFVAHFRSQPNIDYQGEAPEPQGALPTG